MGDQNQLLFNLNVPYNPMNMVTQFYNPGPVVIERLAGGAKPDAGPGPPKQTSDEIPVQFSVVSKEKLSFAMQLARRDLKNKIREQQHQHLRQKLEEKEEGPSKSKRTVKKKNVNKKNVRPRVPPAISPQAVRVNVNINKKSVKTQTPPSSKHRKKFADLFNTQKGSPVLVLQSHSQPYSDFERRVRETKAKVSTEAGTTTSTKPASAKQNEEITRLNRELKTCMDRISTLSQQVAESGAVRSPDRATTLRAGLEALMRAERSPPHPIQSSKVKMSPTRQRKPTNKSRLQKPKNRGVILPGRRKQMQSSVPASSETLHFTQPTQSSSSKATAAREVALKNKQTPSDGTGKPTWAPPGSPKSFHRVGSRRQEAISSCLGNDDDDLDESDGSDYDYEDRGQTRSSNPRPEGMRDERLMSKHGEDRGELEEEKEKDKMTRKNHRVEPGYSDDGMHSSMWHKRSNLQRGHESHPDIDRGMVPRHDGKTRRESLRGSSRSGATMTRETMMHKPSVRRKVQFDQPALEHTSQLAGQQRNNVRHALNSHLESNNKVGQRSERTYSRQPDVDDYDDQYSDDDSYGVSLDREQSGHNGVTIDPQASDRFPGTHNGTSKQTLKNYKDKITDLLVDEVIEDAVQELERLDDVVTVTRQAQAIEDAPTLENMLHDLEMMEVEEERIRRRWKEVKYSDPHTSGSAQGQGSNHNHHTWMKGTPLDAQQMERLHEVPIQHTAMLFTKSSPAQSNDTNNFFLHPSSQQNGLDDDVDDLDGVTVGNPTEAIIVAPASEHTHHSAAVNNAPNGLQERKFSRESKDGHPIPVFVPSDMMKRVTEGRDAFKTHLKRTSHQPFGTFDPWKLVENISDDLVDDVLTGITAEVSEVVGHYVETIYASEFDVKAEKTS